MCSKMMTSLVVALMTTLASPRAHAAGEEIMTGAFDAITGVPIMSKLLSLMKDAERTSETPSVLDERLRAVEAMLVDFERRLGLVETKVQQLQDLLVRQKNLTRLSELRRIREQVELINFELKSRPTDATQLAILEFRARQQADALRLAVGFNVWQTTDLQNGLIRDRFYPAPAFELYNLALLTWISAIELKDGDRPQRVVAERGASLREHAGFLRARADYVTRSPGTLPQSLPEHLMNAAYCRLDAVDNYADQQGNCRFAEVCVDEIDAARPETVVGPDVILPMRRDGPAATPILCTWNPETRLEFDGEVALRDRYGMGLMTSLAEALTKLAATGTLRPPFVGQFPSFILTGMYSKALDKPLQAAMNAANGTPVMVPTCAGTVLVVGGGTCPEAAADLHSTWMIDGQTKLIRHEGSQRCFDVEGGVGAAGARLVVWDCNGTQSQQWTQQRQGSDFRLVHAASQLCATVQGPPSGGGTGLGGLRTRLDLRRAVVLDGCNNSGLQALSGVDSTYRGPN